MRPILTLENQKSFRDTIGAFRKSWDNVSCLINDSFNSYKTLLKSSEQPLIVCGSLWIKISVQDILDCYKDILEKISCLMVKLCSFIIEANLKKFDVSFSLNKEWYSCYTLKLTFQDVKRNDQLNSSLLVLQTTNVDALCLSKRKIVDFSSCCNCLTTYNLGC